jgi:16S rRNA (adenine1518-N6/adenine1519-N6)-dimethyltransferase
VEKLNIETKHILYKFNIKPKKRLGQHFLISDKVLYKIIEELDLKKFDTVIEIGSGFGLITKRIAKIVNKVIAIEIDSKLCEIMKKVCEESKNISIENIDVLDFDFSMYKNSKVFGNLPYYITSPIFDVIIKNLENIQLALVMVQKEVANRIFAHPNTKDYSSFSIFMQVFSDAKKVCDVNKTNFFPKPDVDSTLVKIKKKDINIQNPTLFLKIVKTLFSQRRKMIRNTLQQIISKEKIEFICSKANINPKFRPEELSISDFIKLAECINNVKCIS